MIKSLRLTILQCEDLPSPLAFRLHVSGSRVRQVTTQKPFEVATSTHVTLKLYSAGELIGLLPMFLTVTLPESKWLPVAISTEEIRWSEVIGEVSQGSRIRLSIEPIRPLSPILELTETRENSLLDSPSSESSLLSTLQKERESHNSALREMQLKVMEVQQELIQVKWQAKMDVEDMEMKCKTQISTLTANLDKTKNALKKESANVETLTSKLKDMEEKLKEAVLKSQSSQIDRLTAELQSKVLEISSLSERLSLSEAANSHLESRLKDAESKLTECKLRSYDTPKKSTAPSEKASEQSQERPSDCLISDLVEDLLQEYVQRHKVTVPIVRVEEGVYVIGKKQVEVKACRGQLGVKDHGKQMTLEEFLGRKQASHRRLDSRPKSVEPEGERHFRSMSNFIDLLGRPSCDSSVDLSVRMPTDHSLERRKFVLSRKCGLDYRKGTISSTNKRREKRASISERSRILRL